MKTENGVGMQLHGRVPKCFVCVNLGSVLRIKTNKAKQNQKPLSALAGSLEVKAFTLKREQEEMGAGQSFIMSSEATRAVHPENRGGEWSS